uniref:Uncharacterized protein n=1 Tax=Anguilla anguilla TaxID=7936 RepID=A0A0E9TQ80_ANGAN
MRIGTCLFERKKPFPGNSLQQKSTYLYKSLREQTGSY